MSKFVLTAQLQLQAPNNVKQVVQQIQSQLQGVSVNIQVQGSPQAQKQLQQVTQQANQATSAAERMGKAFALSIRRFAAFSIATRAVGLFTSTLSDAVQTSIDFERQLIKVSQVTGKSLGQLRGLTKQITDLSTGFGVASSDLLNVSTILAQAGLSAEDTAVALKTLAKSALAPNFDSITETAEGAIAVLAQFQEGVGSLEKQLGSINAVAGAFAVEAGDLIDVIRRTGGVFKSSGGDLNELLALFTSVRATTRESAESIGTGLRTIFTRIQRPKTIEFLKQFGVELVDLNGKFVGPYEAVKKLSEALAGLGEGDTTFIRIAEELGGFRQIGKVLPLLQQFSTAQSALNVAMKAGDSLTQDAASSQAALAIRIMKVKEEFLALVRSITETSTFQVMANTALSLASALIKIGDSIKPLLPMLAALTAFKLVKGMGSFFGGMMSGAASGRTYNKGGKVLGFARGGLVPGAGNGDTVPAMLAPGEFVIRKSSVNKMGAGRLAAMNENKYAYGGKARTFGIAALDGTQDSKSVNLPISAVREKLGINTDKAGSKNLDMVIRGVLGSKGADLNVTAKSDTVTLNDPGIKDAIYNNIKSQMYGLITSSATALSNGTGIPIRKRSINPNKVLAKVGTDSTIGSVFEGALGLLGGPFSAGKSTAAIDYPRGLGKMSSAFSSLANMPVDAKKTADSKKTSEMLNKKIPNFFAEFVRRSPQYGSFKSQLSQGRLDTLKGREFDITEYRRVTGNSKATTADLQNVANISRKSGNRQLFTLRNLGGLIQRFAEGGEVLERGREKYLVADVVKAMRELQNNPALSDKDAVDLFNSRDARGDIIYTSFGGKGSIKPPKWLVPYKPPQSAAYGRWQQNQANNQNRIASSLAVRGKTMRDYEGRREFATGGGVGTDTVPALLTPGEFVVNRKSAQSIGYGALNRMNKVGKYAKGGVVNGQHVQRFFVGGQADKDAVRAQGTVLTNIGQAETEFNNIMGSTAEDLRNIILSKFEGIKEIKSGDTYKAKDKDGMLVTKSMENTRGIAVGQRAMGFQIKGKNVSATTETVAHETGHIIDTALGGGKKASNTQGTFQSDVTELVKPEMIKAFAKQGKSADEIAKYLSSNEELFAEFFAKASPEVRAILSSTTDSKIGMEKLAGHLEKAGSTYAGLEASDIPGYKPTPSAPPPPPVTPPKKPNVPSAGGGGGPPDDTTQGYIKKMTAVVKDRTKVLEQAKQEEQKALGQHKKHTDAIKALEAKLVKSSASYNVNENVKLQQQIKHHTEKLKIADQKTEAVLTAEARLAASVKRRAELIDQARVEKAAATTARQSTLQGGTPSTFRASDSAIQLQKQKAAAQAAALKKEAAQVKKEAARNQSSFGSGMMPKDIGGAAIAVSMVTASLEAMLPPLDENSSALTKISHSFLGLITTVAGVAFALQSFGIALKAQSVMKFLGGGGLSGDGIQSVFSAVKGMGGSTNLAGNIAGLANGFAKMLGPTLLVVGGLKVLSMATDALVDAFYGNAEKAKQAAIQKGDIEEAGKQGRIASNRSTATAGVFGTAAAGAAIGATIGVFAGSIVPIIGNLAASASGAIIGAGIGAIIGAVGLLTDPFGQFGQEAANTAMAFAANTKASNDLNYAQTQAAIAAEKFKNGTISASEYLDTFSQAGKSVQESRKYTDAVVKQSTEGKSEIGSGAILRNIGAYFGGGLFGMETAATRNTRLSQESVDAVKGQRENESKLFDSSTEARNAMIRSTLARGGSVEDAQAKIKEKTGFDAEEMRIRASSLRLQAERARQSGDVKLASELDTQATGLFGQADQLEASFENLAKEVKRQKDLYNALNLGLRSATATSTALSASMSKFSSGLEVGGSSFVSDVEFLQSAMSSAAQAMDSGEIQSAVKGVSNNLREFGSSEKYIQKFEGNVAAFTKAQSNYTQAFDNIKKSMKAEDFKGLSADKLKDKFAEELTKGMGDGEAKDSLKKVIQSLELEPGDVDKIIGGDLSVFGDKLTESQQKMLEPIMKISQERAKAEQVLIDFTKKRIDAERNLVAAQQEALDLVMEGREIQGKYGGQAVTGRERKDNLLAKSNAESSRLGLTNMKSGDVGDLRRRNAEIMAGFSNIEGRRTQQGGMEKRSGVEADEAQKDLQKAYKTQIDTIRGLIKLEEEQLKITQEKNKLEKDSMESLVKGDVEDFFKKQSAVGATAAIASGDTRLQNLYGADALGMAAQDIQRQQEAGVQSLYGQQLAGSGGLTEAAANAALSSRGVTDMRAAQVMAGTTAEEEASKARLRELGGMLGETGNMGTQMAEMQVETATINVNSADLKFKEVMAKGNKAAAEAQAIEDQKAMARGGMVYASRGIFVPRGTDTVPAMLTPGEFVINRGAVQRGNNLQILQAMNSGAGGVSSIGGTALMARGGPVRYLSDGNKDPVGNGGGMFENMANFVTSLSNFGSQLKESIGKLTDTNISIKLDSSAVNINLNDGGLLNALTGQVRKEIFGLIETQFKVVEGGRLKQDSGVK